MLAVGSQEHRHPGQPHVRLRDVRPRQKDGTQPRQRPRNLNQDKHDPRPKHLGARKHDLSDPRSTCGGSSCDQTVATAAVDVACAAAVSNSSSIFATAGYLGDWASDAQIAALAALPDATAAVASASAAGASAPASIGGVIVALQAEDVDSYDAPCDHRYPPLT